MLKNKNKKTLLLASLILVIVLGVGVTVAFLLTNTQEVKNTFTPSEVTVDIIEEFDGETKENVVLKNTSNTDAFIRAEVSITWQTEDGNVYGTLPVAGEDYTITFADDSNWILGADGFYYYTKEVAPDGLTTALIKSCTVKKAAPMDGYSLNIDIFGAAVQADGGSYVTVDGNDVWQPAVQQAWSSDKVIVTVDKDGKLVVTPVAATN